MSQLADYGETTTDKVIKYLSEWQYAQDFKTIFDGDPGDIPQNEQPCLSVDLIGSDVEQLATGMDNVTERILVKVIVNMRTYQDDFEGATVGWKKRLQLMVQGTNPTTGQYDPSTLLGVLRHQLTLGGYTLSSKMSTRFGEVPRGVEGDDENTGEAHVTMTVSHNVETPGKV